MTAPVRITAREEIGGRVYLRTAQGDTFEEALADLHKQREKPLPERSDDGATMYRGLGGLTEPQ